MKCKKHDLLLDPESSEYYVLEAAIKNVIWGPFDLGQVIAQTLAGINKSRQRKISVLKFTTVLARTFPYRSERWYRRLYKVYSQLVVQARLKRDDLRYIDMEVLYIAAESMYLDPSTLKKTMLYIAGHYRNNFKGARKYLWTVIDRQKSSIQNLAGMILNFDARFVEDLLRTEKA